MAKVHTKVFNGKTYRYAVSNPSKAGAIDAAERLRKQGKFAGVVQEVDKATGKKIYSVYTRG